MLAPGGASGSDPLSPLSREQMQQALLYLIRVGLYASLVYISVEYLYFCRILPHSLHLLFDHSE